MDAAAVAGVGWFGLRAIQCWRSRGARRRGVIAEVAASFGPWADALWRECLPHYAMAGVRDAQTLNVLFPPDNPRFLRLRVREQDRTIGWVVAGERDQKDHPQSGDLRGGVVLDAMAH